MPKSIIQTDHHDHHAGHSPGAGNVASVDAVNLASAQALAVQLLKDGNLKARVLPDGSVAALLQLIYTRAICLGCTYTGWSRRFCFQDQELAEREFLALQGEDDTPSGFIAQR